MTQKKVCMLGSFAVGKTSLAQRFLRGVFSDPPASTVGVKIDRKPVELDGRDLNLIVWDIHGDDEFQRIHGSYLRGASGHLLVADGTRAATLETIPRLRYMAERVTPGASLVLVLNKSDATEQWKLDETAVRGLEDEGWTVVETSAKSGAGVELAFTTLARAMLDR